MEGPYTTFLYLLVSKNEQFKWLCDHYETLEQDKVCPKSLTYCKVRPEWLEKNKEFKVMRILVLQDGKKKVIEKIRLKNIAVKTFGEQGMYDSDKESLSMLENELNEKRQGLQT